MEIEKTTYMTLLYDFYGSLLTIKQKEYLELYYADDLSLSEISEELNVSRQAVYDNIKRSGRLLEHYEQRLQLVAQYQWQQKQIHYLLNYVSDKYPQDKALYERLKEIEKGEMD